MTRQALFLLLLSWVACAFAAPPASSGTSETEPYDRIVLKDMTVIKASLVKEAGDSLAYFELGDNDFVKHSVDLSQVFKWVKATPAAAAPPPAAADDNMPVVDYQIVIARLDAVARGNAPVATASYTPAANAVASERGLAASGAVAQSPLPVPAPAPVPSAKVPMAAPAVAGPAVSAAPAETPVYDSDEAIPEDLTKVRLDPPTGTEGVKLVPRSGMLAININPSLSGLGLGLRGWSPPGLGFGVKGAVLWGSATGFLLNGEIMQALNTASRNRWYFFIGGGYQWSTITVDLSSISSGMSDMTMDLSFGSFIVGIGVEWRKGINRNHGISFELGYQKGSAEYTTDAYTVGYGSYSYTMPEQTNTFDLSPIYLGFNYAYYF
ncbi:MAG: hypothetical protein V1913_11020 [Fibrobacterota bacterium]